MLENLAGIRLPARDLLQPESIDHHRSWSVFTARLAMLIVVHHHQIKWKVAACKRAGFPLGEIGKLGAGNHHDTALLITGVWTDPLDLDDALVKALKLVHGP